MHLGKIFMIAPVFDLVLLILVAQFDPGRRFRCIATL